MSIQLQIAIPLFVTFGVLALIAIIRRYFRPEIFVIGVAVLGLATTCTVSHVLSSDTQAGQETPAATQSSEFGAALASQYMLDGRYDAARELLDSLWHTGGEDEPLLRAAARCAVLTQDYPTAVQLYGQLDGVGEETEQAVRLLASTRSNDDAMVAYLNQLGENPGDYGLSASGIPAGDYDAAKADIEAALTQELEEYKEETGKAAARALEKTAQLDALFDSYLATGEKAQLDEVQQTLKELAAAVKDEPKLAANLPLRLARMKGYVLTGEYSQIAAKADRNTSAEELVVLAQLLSSDMIEKKSFSESFASRDVTQYEQVLERCKNTLELQQDELDSAVTQKYKKQISVLKEQVKDPVEFALRQDLLSAATDGDSAMQSKCYLALAKLENADGNADQAAVYITEALGTAANSDDQNYQIPMNKMNQIIQGTTSASEVMQVAEYVADALDHSLPLDISVSELNADAEVSEDLSDQMTETVNTSTATVNIGVIDKDEFPTVKAKVQIQSEKWVTLEDLKAHLKVYDCSSQIEDFQLEKVEYQASKIILLCDCSGSMGGSVESLKQVVRDFAATMGEGEEVCVVGFNDRISFITGFSADKTEVSGFADQIYASGGTALFNSLLESGELLTHDINTNNIIIAMTDGQDGNMAGEGDMYNKIGALASEKGLTVYTVGLGSVDADYLSLMAQCGNGSFLYAQSEEELQAFYDFIHGQLNNQYILTFTAKNQTRNERILELTVDGELGSARKTYYLEEPEHTNEGSDAYSPYTVEDTEVTVNGLTAKFLYKSSQNQNLTLKGSGFDSGDDVTVRLIGSVKYDLVATFVDSETYSLVLPSGVSAGQYDLEVSVADCSVTLKKELTVAVQGSLKSFRYGSYVFTALESRVDDNGNTVLSNNVIMNGWLRFKGDVTISAGYQDSAKAWITDNGGFYVSYSPDMSSGLAHFLADQGIPLSFGAIGKFAIYPDAYIGGDYASFPVDEAEYDDFINLLMFVCDDFSIGIYPDMLRVQGLNFTFKLPFQEQIMRSWEQTPSKALDFDSDCMISATKIGLQGTVQYKDMDKENGFTLVSLPLKLKELDIQIDTLNNNYSFAGKVGIKALDADGFGASVSYLDGKLDSIALSQDMLSIPIVTAPVPVTIDGFGFYIGQLSQIPDDADFITKVLDSEVGIDFDVSVASLNKYVPKIAKLLDSEKDIALAEFKDCTLRLRLRNFRVAFNAKVVLATVLELGEVDVSVGCFSYSNRLIGMYNADEVGLRIASRLDVLNWHTANLDLNLNGTRELCIGYPYSGMWDSGTADFTVGWGFWEADWSVTGDAMAGAFVNSLGNFQFSVILRGENKDGEQSGFHAYVTFEDGFKVSLY